MHAPGGRGGTEGEGGGGDGTTRGGGGLDSTAGGDWVGEGGLPLGPGEGVGEACSEVRSIRFEAKNGTKAGAGLLPEMAAPESWGTNHCSQQQLTVMALRMSFSTVFWLSSRSTAHSCSGTGGRKQTWHDADI